MAIPLDLTAVMAVSLFSLRLLSDHWRMRRRMSMVVMPDTYDSIQVRQPARAAPRQLPGPKRAIPDIEVLVWEPGDTLPMHYLEDPN